VIQLNLFEALWLAGLAVYLFGIYRPRVRAYRASRSAGLRSRGIDFLLDFLAWVGWQVVPLVYIFSHWLDFASYPLPAWASWTGAFILLAALWLYRLAYNELGRNWSPKIEIMSEQSLVTTGIYGRIRHPVYAAMWLWGFSQPLLLHNWIAGFSMIVIFIPLYLMRMPREEAMLREHFGPAYEHYMTRTGRLLPRLRRKP